MVGLPLLVERLLEQARGLVHPQPFGESPRRAVPRDLVVLDPLRRADQPGIAHRGVALLLDHLAPLADQPFHPLALVALRALPQILEDPLQATDLFLGDALVLLERVLQRRMA